MVLLSGALDVEASDSGVVRLSPGDVLLVEDTLGRGISRGTAVRVTASSS
jgi:hypothetical protein